MDNQSFQPYQQPTQAMPQTVGGQPGQPVPGQPVPGQPLQPVAAAPKANKSLILMIVAVVSAIAAATFIGLFIWMYAKWDVAKRDVDGQVMAAVATAVNENTEELENQFTEREKSPYRTFAGPADYGELSFEFPKTWSVYEARDAANGGDYEAYLNPDKVYTVNSSTINALRVTIKDKAYDSYISTYDSALKNGKIQLNVRPINGENANVYSGELPSTKFVGMVAVFKIRDKTAILQTDAMLFADDFQKILDSVHFNQ
ncbi:hypothetical protein IKE07_00575 [Candidatus Saccharibacteria bacterium]|nr:hypothetical protein [Candidatus Saccharibacteria bacterium]